MHFIPLKNWKCLVSNVANGTWFRRWSKELWSFKIHCQGTSVTRFPGLKNFRKSNFYPTKSSDFLWKLSTQPIQHIYNKIKVIWSQKNRTKASAQTGQNRLFLMHQPPFGFLPLFQLILTYLTLNQHKQHPKSSYQSNKSIVGFHKVHSHDFQPNKDTYMKLQASKPNLTH